MFTLGRWCVPMGLLALFGIVSLPSSATSCPFCASQGKTLVQEVGDASMVVFGTLKNAKLTGTLGEGTTDLEIESVIKDHEYLKEKKVLTLSRYVPNEEKTKFLVFCDYFKGRVDPYLGRAIKPNTKVDVYLKGALALPEKDMAKRLRFFFDYLDHEDPEINGDALKEWANSEYKDYREMAKSLPAAKLSAWLKDETTPSHRLGLYGSLLGHCGKPEDANLLLQLLEKQQKLTNNCIDGVLAGYTLLQPKEGWEFTLKLLKNPKNSFSLRYATLRSVRFFWEYRPDLFEKKQLLEGLAYLLQQDDIADLVIEDFRKWGQWQLAEKIVPLFSVETHSIPIIRRSIVRFALSASAKEKQAADFVAKLRVQEPDLVAAAEELLQLEKKAEPKSEASSSAKPN